MDIKYWIGLIICIVIACILGYSIGKKRGAKPTAAGVIDFEKREDGSIGCVFKLEGDVDWIAKQDYIIFEVRNGKNAQ